MLAVATEVFAESGYSGARVDEIAERTRTTKRMIYYYFGGKEQLYLAVLENAYRGIREAEQKLQVDHVDPVVAMRRLAELTFDHHLDHQAFIRLVSIENIHRGEFIGRLRLAARRCRGRPPRCSTRSCARGREQGVFRADVDALDVHIVISSYCVFQVANKLHLRLPVRRRLHRAPQRAHMRRMIGDVVVGWLTARTDLETRAHNRGLDETRATVFYFSVRTS